ncbi:MAG: hypothetical protein WB502_04230 [Thermoactinomyces sp.]
MDRKKQLGIHIEGCIFSNDENANIDPDEFWDAFIEFVESRGWHFGGGINQIDQHGETV